MLTTKIIPTIEEMINAMLKQTMKYRMKITYMKEKIIIRKVSGKGEILPFFSYGEGFIANVCFRITISQYNKCLRSDFMIMDESLSSCDKETINKIPSLLSVIKKYFTWILIISHDDKIINLYDDTLKINIEDNGSHVKYN